MSDDSRLAELRAGIVNKYGEPVMGEIEKIAASPDLHAETARIVATLGIDQVRQNIENGLRRIAERRAARERGET